MFVCKIGLVYVRSSKIYLVSRFCLLRFVMDITIHGSIPLFFNQDSWPCVLFGWNDLAALLFLPYHSANRCFIETCALVIAVFLHGVSGSLMLSSDLCPVCCFSPQLVSCCVVFSSCVHFTIRRESTRKKHAEFFSR